MRIVVVGRLREFVRQHADAAGSLASWEAIVKAADWRQFTDVRRTISSADAVTLPKGNVITVFNVGGGSYRLLTHVKFNTRCVYVKALLTHAEYDTDRWKERLDHD